MTGSRPQRGGIHHVALEVREADADGEVGFWRLLGFAEVDPPGTLSGRARWVERDGTQVHLLFSDEPVVPPGGHTAIVAADYRAVFALLRDSGFAPESRTEHWGSPRAFVRSPAGHRVELMAHPPGAGA